jgi:hypothetical protein
MTADERESRDFMRGLAYGLTFSAALWAIVVALIVWVLS